MKLCPAGLWDVVDEGVHADIMNSMERRYSLPCTPMIPDRRISLQKMFLRHRFELIAKLPLIPESILLLTAISRKDGSLIYPESAEGAFSCRKYPSDAETGQLLHRAGSQGSGHCSDASCRAWRRKQLYVYHPCGYFIRNRLIPQWQLLSAL